MWIITASLSRMRCQWFQKVNQKSEKYRSERLPRLLNLEKKLVFILILDEMLTIALRLPNGFADSPQGGNDEKDRK